jgi:hypothetical protein
VGDGQALTCGQLGVLGEVVVQRLFQFVRPGVLALDAIRVVRVHRAQQAAQLRGNGLAGQRGGSQRQIVGLGEQWLLAGRTGQQRFELMGRVVHAPIRCELAM